MNFLWILIRTACVVIVILYFISIFTEAVKIQKAHYRECAAKNGMLIETVIGQHICADIRVIK